MDLTTLQPILIASPVRRSGTTLLQRLLCSASNAIIYGENCAHELVNLSSLYVFRQMIVRQRPDERDRQLQQVLKGEVNEWIPDLMPEVNVFLPALKEAYFSIFRFLTDYSDSLGRPVWGVKQPEWDPNSLIQLLRLLPRCKVIYLVRDLGDCVRSAKAFNAFESPVDIDRFCRQWQQFADLIQRQLPNPRILWLNYRELIEEPDIQLPKIEEFTGARGINPEVLSHRINDYLGSKNTDGHDSEYIRPAELEDKELEIIRKFEVV